MTTLAATESFRFPCGVAISPNGLYALVGDQNNHQLRLIAIDTGQVTTLAGSSQGFADGIGSSAQFRLPAGVAFFPGGASALIADFGNNRIRRIEITTRVVTTLAGAQEGFADATGTMAFFHGPSGVAITPDGIHALVADYHNFRVRRIVIDTGAVTTLAGSGSTPGYLDGTGTLALFSRLSGIAVSPDGKFALVTDEDNNNRVRRIDIATRMVTTLAGSSHGQHTDGFGTSASFFKLGLRA